MNPRLVSRIADISATDWNLLQGADTAFTCHQFLEALESSGSASKQTGWLPMHLVWEEQGKLLAALPLYRKYHSYGEYVFDWSWADAYQQTGEAYYPKLLCAIPYTPVPGPRLLYREDLDPGLVWRESLAYVRQFLKQQQLSSMHLLFSNTTPEEPDSPLPLLSRQDVQFVWRNNGYRDFDDFLATLKSSKRKQIRRERRKVAEQGVEISTFRGNAITEQELVFFCQCYQATYLKRSGHEGYLAPEFFQRIHRTMPEKLALVVATKAERRIASALFFVDSDQLSGRYWGCIENIDCLHFELCYYQGIDLCIDEKLNTFNPGTQGEHKLVRGFEPQRTRSYHLFEHQGFHEAVRRSLVSEKAYIDAYESSAKQHLPFRAD